MSDTPTAPNVVLGNFGKWKCDACGKTMTSDDQKTEVRTTGKVGKRKAMWVAKQVCNDCVAEVVLQSWGK